MMFIQPNLDLGRVRGATGPGVGGPARAGFSLTELIIVIGIIVLFIAVAIPAFNIITGQRSIAGAQNLLSAEVAGVRMRAIAQQRHMGLVLMLNQDERITLRRCEVLERHPGAQLVVELVPESEPVLLPAGVSMQFLRAPGGGSAGRYAGFIENGQPVARIMMFDPGGRVELTPYWYARSDGSLTLLGEMLGLTSSAQPSGGAPKPEIGLLLFDRADFAGQFSFEDIGSEAAEENWLDENGTLLVLSRYNGTFVQEGR